MDDQPDADALFDRLDLGEYETTALKGLLTHGRSTAPNLAEATGIPNARIYGVLDELADRGFVEVIPGRPKEFQPKPPAEILDRAVENRQQAFESFRAELDELREPFLETYQPRYQRASEDRSPAEELFHVVDVGKPSESETRSIYRDAERTLRIMTKSFEYFERVRPALETAVDRGVEIDVLFVHPEHLSEHNSEIQAEIAGELAAEFPSLDLRFSEKPLPWRGTLADPSMDYETGIAIILVEEKDIPLHLRQAAVTENGSFVAGLNRYFELIWEYESVGSDAIETL
ncbi:TrmB family transcriptional regulator [Halovenus sp. WSH3]|uniref:TrmB family transcriptional regulator n=1 Tax=Halovenus carboxidivorans TaxID=2692199 RepID=A0A6B0T6A1_9EURY|nr:helix-turn-helix domain-containing protein [Halovenus carboxidivorans]MXR51716.1 TrmB family transcriptional regulator [Halovenus carboxidivorans]